MPRNDAELDVDCALKIAKIDRSRGIKATFGLSYVECGCFIHCSKIGCHAKDSPDGTLYRFACSHCSLGDRGDIIT